MRVSNVKKHFCNYLVHKTQKTGNLWLLFLTLYSKFLYIHSKKKQGSETMSKTIVMFPVFTHLYLALSLLNLKLIQCSDTYNSVLR